MLRKIFVLSQQSKGHWLFSDSCLFLHQLNSLQRQQFWMRSDLRTEPMALARCFFASISCWYERKHLLPLIMIRAMLTKGLPGCPWADWSAAVVRSRYCQRKWIVNYLGDVIKPLGVTTNISRDHEDFSKMNGLICSLVVTIRWDFWEIQIVTDGAWCEEVGHWGYVLEGALSYPDTFLYAPSSAL